MDGYNKEPTNIDTPKTDNQIPEDVYQNGTAAENKKRSNRLMTGMTVVFRILMIITALIVLVAGTMAFGYFSGTTARLQKAVQENGISLSAVWKALNAEETQEEPESPEIREAAQTEGDNTGTPSGGAVYIKDNVTYIRADIDVKDDKITDSDDPAYRIKVNLAFQCVTVYKILNEYTQTPIRTFLCSTAREGEETPEGTFPLLETYDWCFLEDGSYAQYAMRIGGDIGDGYMFHTVPYTSDKKSTLEWYEYDKLGSPASLGCIRIPAGEMYWLREHVSSGGEVIIYTDYNSPGELGLPQKYFIPEEVTKARGWDPTDPDSKNPWHSYDLTLKVPDGITVKKSDAGLDITEYASAEDIYGNDLSRYITFQQGEEKYGFTYVTHNYNDPDEYTDEKGNVDYDALIEIENRKMDISRAGEYEIKVAISVGPILASRTITLTVTD